MIVDHQIRLNAGKQTVPAVVQPGQLLLIGKHLPQNQLGETDHGGFVFSARVANKGRLKQLDIIEIENRGDILQLSNRQAHLVSLLLSFIDKQFEISEMPEG